MASKWEKLAGETGEAVPSGRLGRMMRLGSLGLSVGVSTVAGKLGGVVLPGSRDQKQAATTRRLEKNAERVVREAERLETLTRQILDFARTGSIDRSPVDPAELLRGAADQVGDPRVQLDVRTAPAAWDLDRDRMNQVLVNLIKNAVQASPDEAAVDARCAVEAGALVFTVRDRGDGFPPGEAEAAFEPFRTHRVQGTGLGLPIARRIVAAHGGTIEALNAPDGGAVVRVWIPAGATATTTT